MTLIRIVIAATVCFFVSLSCAASPFTEPLENIVVMRAEHVVSMRILGFAQSFSGGSDPRVLEVELRTRAGVRLYSKGIHMQMVDASGLPLALSFSGTPAAVREYDPWYKETRDFFVAGTIFSISSQVPFHNGGDLRIRFEACNNKKCLMPETFHFQIQPGVEGLAGGVLLGELKGEAAKGEARSSTQASLPLQSTSQATPLPSVQTEAPGAVGSGLEARISNQVLNGGIWVLPLLFLAGLLMNLTPCVYPMIPITLSVLGRFRKQNSSKGPWLPLVFVLGVAASYSSMGVVAGLTGNVFGAILQSVWVQVGIAALMFLLGLGMMGVLNFTKLQEWGSRVPLSEKSPAAAVFVMGGVSGLVSAPCTGPVLATLLLLVSQTQDALRGFILLFVFAFGFGAPYLVLGAVLHKAKRLPQLGFFEEIIKFVFAALIFALALYYARGFLISLPGVKNLFTRPSTFVASAMLVAGVVLLFAADLISNPQVELERPMRHQFARWTRGISIFPLTLLALWLTLLALKSFPANEAVIHWETSWEKVRERLKTENKPLLVDVWADWCASCKEMDASLWTQAEVADVVNTNFVALKLDFSQESDESKRITKIWNLGGLPAVGFYDKNANFDNPPIKLFREKMDWNLFLSTAKDILANAPR